MSYIKKTVISAMCAALCVILPMAVHMIPNAGSIISPMHIPVLLCGLICGWQFGILCGLVGPSLSSFITGMPPLMFMPGMMVELAVYGAVTGLLSKYVRTKNRYADLYICLVSAMIAGRIVAGIARALVISPGAYTFELWVSGYLISTIPAIIIQLVLIPIIIIALERARFTTR